MTDRPIIFSEPMVKALIAGRKTQTRRLCEPTTRIGYALGDRLYVREAFQGHSAYEAHGYKPSDWGNKPIWYCADGEPDPLYSASIRKRPSIHMPRWASRLTLTVTDVRVQRLNDISEADAWAEGCRPGEMNDLGNPFPADEPDPSGIGERGWDCAGDWFADLCNTIHGPSAWDANPWVVAISFDVRRGNIDMTPAVPA